MSEDHYGVETVVQFFDELQVPLPGKIVELVGNLEFYERKVQLPQKNHTGMQGPVGGTRKYCVDLDILGFEFLCDQMSIVDSPFLQGTVFVVDGILP
jgi:hypothetical protein